MIDVLEIPINKQENTARECQTKNMGIDPLLTMYR